MAGARSGGDDRWFALAFVLILLTLALARAAQAAEPPSAPESRPVTPLGALEPAPFPGLLVPEDVMVGYLRGDVDLEECRLRVAARDRVLASLPAAPGPAPGPRWTFWVGAVGGLAVGVFLGGLLVYEAFRLAGT